MRVCRKAVNKTAAINTDVQNEDSAYEPNTELVSPAESARTADESFQLLSAYLDDEVTGEERCLVEHLLASDSEMKSHYQKQLRLRQAFKALTHKN